MIAEATGNAPFVNAPMVLAAWRGDEPEAAELIEATSAESPDGGGPRTTMRRPCCTTDSDGTTQLSMRLGRPCSPTDGYGTSLVPELAEAAAEP